MNYYNTTNQAGDALKAEWNNATNQAEKIFILFKKYPERAFSPFEVLDKVFKNNTPITSVRRAITDLTKCGKLIKTSEQVTGPYGKSVHCWKLGRQ